MVRSRHPGIPTGIPPAHGRHGKHGKDRVHGEPDPAPDAGDSGDDTANEPNYGAGDSGSDFAPDLETGGLDPFANVVQPGDGAAYDGFAEPAFALDDYTDDLEQSYQPVGPDPYDPAIRIPTLRNYQADFGFEPGMYSGFGPAAVIGCEVGLAGAGLKK